MSEAETSRVKVSCRNVWKIFGPDPQNTLNLIQNGITREEILEQTGHIVAVRDVSFDVT